MVGKDLEDCKKHLKELDEHTLERRAVRHLELPSITTDGRQDFSQRQWDYSSEASANYIAGHYRSAIFSCACAIDQIFRYEYLKGATNKGSAIKYLNKRITFGQLIEQVENQINSFGSLRSLAPFIEKAKLLNNIRNAVAVHPLLIDVPLREQSDRTLKDYWLAEDLKMLINLVDKIQPGSKRDILDKMVKTEKAEYKFGEIIGKEFKIDKTYIASEPFWEIVQEYLLRVLSLKSIEIMKGILEGLYHVS